MHNIFCLTFQESSSGALQEVYECSICHVFFASAKDAREHFLSRRLKLRRLSWKDPEPYYDRVATASAHRCIIDSSEDDCPRSSGSLLHGNGLLGDNSQANRSGLPKCQDDSVNDCNPDADSLSADLVPTPDDGLCCDPKDPSKRHSDDADYDLTYELTPCTDMNTQYTTTTTTTVTTITNRIPPAISRHRGQQLEIPSHAHSARLPRRQRSEYHPENSCANTYPNTPRAEWYRNLHLEKSSCASRVDRRDFVNCRREDTAAVYHEQARRDFLDESWHHSESLSSDSSGGEPWVEDRETPKNSRRTGSNTRSNLYDRGDDWRRWAAPSSNARLPPPRTDGEPANEFKGLRGWHGEEYTPRRTASSSMGNAFHPSARSQLFSVKRSCTNLLP